jgi:hypothetical protein
LIPGLLYKCSDFENKAFKRKPGISLGKNGYFSYYNFIIFVVFEGIIGSFWSLLALKMGKMLQF